MNIKQCNHGQGNIRGEFIQKYFRFFRGKLASDTYEDKVKANEAVAPKIIIGWQ